MSLRESIFAQVDVAKPLVFIDNSAVTVTAFLGKKFNQIIYNDQGANVALGYKGFKMDDRHNYIFIDIKSKEWSYSEKMDALRNAQRRLLYALNIRHKEEEQAYFKRALELNTSEMPDLVPVTFRQFMSKENCKAESGELKTERLFARGSAPATTPNLPQV